MTPWTPFPGSLCLAAPLQDLPRLSPYVQEHALHPRATEQRRQQSWAARALARAALRQLGGPEVAIGHDAGGAAQWPAGWTGSLSHADGMAAALVAPSSCFAALGIDIEPHQPLPEDAAALVLDASERRALAQLPGGYARWSRAVFAAKECVHKCVHPWRGAWLEFEEVRIHLDPAADRFSIEPLGAAAQAACAGIGGGVLLFAGDHVLAALAAERSDA